MVGYISLYISRRKKYRCKKEIHCNRRLSTAILLANRKHFVFDEFNEKYKIMTSYCASKPLLYKCYINNINNNIFVTKTIIDKIPEDYKLCKFNEVLEYCTQLSLTL